jgi:hypothetical protein
MPYLNAMARIPHPQSAFFILGAEILKNEAALFKKKF